MITHLPQVAAQAAQHLQVSKTQANGATLSHILQAGWPEADKAAMVQDTVEYVIQVNGKLRGNMQISCEANKEAIEKMTLEQTYVTKFLLEGTSVRKIIVVPNKLVNVVIS